MDPGNIMWSDIYKLGTTESDDELKRLMKLSAEANGCQMV